MYKIIKNTNKVVFSALISFYSCSAFSADVSSGAQKAELCFGCHGEKGISMSDAIPNLAGQKAEYLLKAFNDYKKGARKNSMMQSIAVGVSEEDAKEIVAHFSSL